MLYIFHVDTGTMMTFDMNLAAESVRTLQGAISRSCRISQDKQVLLIGGGQNLDPHERVNKYQAGTDTNPIFLFSKSSIESATPPSASVNYGSEADLKEQVEGSLNMSASYETVVARSQLALQIQDLSKDSIRMCERLVHDQHLQHQGWAAVIANLDDITKAFTSRMELFVENFSDYLNSRNEYMEILQTFPTTITLLNKIPILPCLLMGDSIIVHSTIEREGDTELSFAGIEEHTRTITLLDWISAQDNKNTLDQMLQQCSIGLQQFNTDLKEMLLKEVSDIIEATNNQSMKEVKGLEDRLYGMEQLMYGARKIVQEQEDMAQGFVQNQQRARNLQDPSVLPDLCSSHRKQLSVMLKNHLNLCDIKRRCTAAKDELSVNLHTRLRWVMYVEKQICDVDSKLMIHHETLKKLKRKLVIIQQMHCSPDMYAQAVVEVVRRKNFSNSFLEWAENLAVECGKTHRTEVEQRDQFCKAIKHHFLQVLFPGFSDYPPPYAVDKPDEFDKKLPPIEPADIEYLKTEVPELAPKLKLPEDAPEFPDKASSSATIRAEISEESPMSKVKFSPKLEAHQSDIVVLPTEGEGELLERAEFDHDHGEVSSISPSASLQFLSTTPTSEALRAGMVPMPKMALAGSDGSHGSNSSPSTSASEKPIVRSQSEPISPAPRTDPSLDPPHEATQPREPSPKGDMGSSTQSVEVIDHDSADGEEDLQLSEEKGEVLDSFKEKTTEHSESSNKSETNKLQVSPNTEDYGSEGFTTADFYIDESMPSSMTESSPKKIQELTLLVQEKNVLLISRDKEIEEQKKIVLDLKPKVETAEENFKLLRDSTEKTSLQLKCDILSLEKQIHKEKDEFQVYMSSVTKELLETIHKFEETKEKERTDLTKNLQDRYELENKQLEEKLYLESQKLNDAQNEIESYERKMKEKLEEYENLEFSIKKKDEEHQQEVEDRVRTTRSELMLEHEVELEKLKADLDSDIDKKDTEILQLNIQLDTIKVDFETKATENDRKYQDEKNQLVKDMEAKFDAQKQQHISEITESLSNSHKEELEQLRVSLEEGSQKALEELKEQLSSSHAKVLETTEDNIKREHEKAVKIMEATIAAEKENEMSDLRDKLEQEYKSVIDSLQSRCDSQMVEMVRLEQGSPGEEYISVTKYDDSVKTLKIQLEKEKTDAVSKALSQLQSTHDQKINELVENFEKEKSDNLQSMKSSLQAEKQVLFNEALVKVTTEKDKVIEERDQSIAEMKKELEEKDKEIERQKSLLDVITLGSPEEVPTSAEPADVDSMSRERLVEEYKESAKQIDLLREQVAQQHDQIQQQSFMVQSMQQSVVPLPDQILQERIEDLEKVLKEKDEEMSRLSSKCNELSMTTSSRSLIQDKVSITTCNKGDIVLLCLDERHDHYVVFTVGTTLHFLHSDCLETLGLKTGTGEEKKNWLLAEIVDKEYCQAKKPHNRFRVPLGTKFYRVKARPWNRDMAASTSTSR